MANTHIYRGFRIARGSFTGTSDDCASGWYVDALSAEYYDRRGPGIRHLADAKARIDDLLAEEAHEEAHRAAVRAANT